MLAEERTRADIETAILRLILRGPVTTRLLWSEDVIWQASCYFGDKQVNAWLRDTARPEQEPPGAETRWRLKAPSR